MFPKFQTSQRANRQTISETIYAMHFLQRSLSGRGTIGDGEPPRPSRPVVSGGLISRFFESRGADQAGCSNTARLGQWKMEYTSEFDPDSGISTIRVTGVYRRPEDSDQLKRVAVDFHKESGCRLFLVDLTRAEVVGGIMPTFNAANPQGELAQSLRQVKAVFVRHNLSPEDLFFQDVALNRGFQLRAFDTLEKAVEWLKKGRIP